MIQLLQNTFDSEKIDIVEKKSTYLWAVIHSDLIAGLEPDDFRKVMEMIEAGEFVGLAVVDKEGNKL